MLYSPELEFLFLIYSKIISKNKTVLAFIGYNF